MSNFKINPAGIRYLQTPRGVAYHATLLQDGVAVACVQHNGDGGGAYVCDIEPEFDNKGFRAAGERIFGAGAPFEELLIERLMDLAESESA